MDSEKLKNVNTILGSIFIITTFLWGVYTFIYKDIFLVNAEPISLKMIVLPETIDQKSIIDNMNLSRMHIKLENNGEKEASIIATVVYVNGYKIKPINMYGKNILEKIPIMDNSKNTYNKVISPMNKDGDLLYWGGLYEDDSIKPKEQIERMITIYNNKNIYNYIEICCITYFAKKDVRPYIEIIPIGNGNFKTSITKKVGIGNNFIEYSDEEIEKYNIRSVSCSYELGY